MATTFTIEPISGVELENILERLGDAASEVDAIDTRTRFVAQSFDEASARACMTEARNEPGRVNYPSLEGRFDAATAWHVHRFALEVGEVADNLHRWADGIDKASYSLFMEVGGPATDV